MRFLLICLGIIVTSLIALFFLAALFFFIPFDEVSEGPKTLEKLTALGIVITLCITNFYLIRSVWPQIMSYKKYFGYALLALIILGAIFQVRANLQTTTITYDLRTWPRMTADHFGCEILEKQFGHRDQRFNCDLKNYQNQGDPCTNTDAYYEGPLFPKDLSSIIDARILGIHLAWEHGDLREVTLYIDKDLSEQEIRDFLQLQTLPENIMDTTFQHCSKKHNCFLLTGFDHMGAGDVDC